MNKTSKKHLIFTILIDILIGIIFLIAVYGIVLKITNQQFYLFGKRADAVLSNSMSEVSKDPAVEAFLKGHDDRLNRGDLIFSSKITKETELKVYDIVLFKDRADGLTKVHRIVRIDDGSKYVDGENRYLIRADAAELNEADGFYAHSDLLAKYEWKIPGIGYIYEFNTSIVGIVTYITIAAGASIGFFFYERAREKERAEEVITKKCD